MAKKILIGLMIGLSLLFTSCYPELSVQQYDKLKEDLKALDVKRAELETEIESLQANIAVIEANNAQVHAEVRGYLSFLEKMVSTQSSERILTGEFDVESLVKAKETLKDLAADLEESKVFYYLDMMNTENESQTVGAYYKAIEYSLKEMKSKLQ
jgi:chromatin segregation and condensation protein Rec8/ScpA/Scc1 (kleisin family)